MDKNNNISYDRFNIYTVIDVIINFWKFIIFIPLFSIVILFTYFYLNPQASTGLFSITINNDNSNFKNYNQLIDMNYGIDLDVTKSKGSGNQKSAGDEQMLSGYSKLVYGILNSNKFIKEILTSSEGNTFIREYYIFEDFTSDVKIEVQRDQNANIDIINIYLILPISDNQMRKIGTKVIDKLEINLQSEMINLINNKKEQLDLLYNIRKNELDTEIEKRNSEIKIQEDLIVSSKNGREFYQMTDFVISNKQVINNLLMAKYDLENDYILNLNFIDSFKKNFKDNKFSVDKENIRYAYSPFVRPYELYVSITILISLFFSILIFVIYQGYKNYRMT